MARTAFSGQTALSGQVFELPKNPLNAVGTVIKINFWYSATIYQMLPNMQPLLQTTRTEVRSNSQHLLVLGGVLRQQLSVSNQLRAYHETKKEWLKLQEMEQPRYQHGIAVIGNFLFVVGGQVIRRLR